MNATLRDALAYATQGLRVFPVHATDDSGACSCGTPGCDSAGKHPRTRNGLKDATIAEAIVRGWFGGAPRANIAISTGASDLVVIDIDVKHGQPGLENWGLLVSLFRNEYGIDLEDTCVVVTPSGGCHYYYRAAGQRVACSAGKLAAGIDVRGDGGYVVAPPSRIAGIAYSFVEDHGLDHVRDLPKALAERLTDIAPITDDRAKNASIAGAPIPQGQRNDRLFRDACAMRGRGHTETEILAALCETNRRCDPPLSNDELRRIVTSATTYDSGNAWPSDSGASATEATKATEGQVSELRWPGSLGTAAFHGPLGDLVRLLEPCNEADPAALLTNALVAFGSLIGSGPHMRVGADLHPTRLFAVLVGESSKARKGMSQGPIRDALTDIDAPWRERIMDGLSSGEGLIWQVRNPIKKLVPKRGKDGDGPEEEIVDPGVSDKRLLISEGEFARVLKVMGRPDNTLSPILRNAWDTGELRSLTKNSPANSSGAHISLVGHITRSELLSLLSSTEAGNGFGNRFLWVCVKRSKVLPYGGTPDGEKITPIIEELGFARRFALGVEEVHWGEDARPLWESIYGELSEGRPGLVGALTARAEAQVLRIALIYAIADCSSEIKRVHLEAALEVWRYCAESAIYIFGQRSGDSVADEILGELCKRREAMDRTEIRDHFQRHVSAARIDAALELLLSLKRVRRENQPTAGRPREVWYAL